MPANAFIIVANKLANDCSFPLPPLALELYRFEQSGEQVLQRRLTNMSYQHLWHFHDTFTHTHTLTHTHTYTHSQVLNIGKLQSGAKFIEVKNRAIILAQLNRKRKREFEREREKEKCSVGGVVKASRHA